MSGFIIVFCVSLLLLFLIIALILGYTYNCKDYEFITNIINKEYPSYEIKDLKLEYVDFFGTIEIADREHSAEMATAIIENEKELITLYFRKDYFNIFNIWYISSLKTNYASSVPKEVYFIDEQYTIVGKAVDIDEHIKGWWVIPGEDGNLYTKRGNDTNWYYSFKECTNIYKTKDGYVYVFNKKISDWEKATETYDDFCCYGNHKKVTKEYAIEIIEKYSSYREY